MANYVRFERSSGVTGAGLLEGDIIAVINEPFWESTERTGESVALNSVRILPPTEPRNIVCVGLNYKSHLNGRPAPNPPTLFLKPLSSIAGEGDEVVLPEGAGRVDPEGEIVIVIGKTIHGEMSRDEAVDAIFGYTCGNDVSAREWQSADVQWWRAKGCDTFGVFGPSIATGLDFNSIELKTRVNGVDAQHGWSHELILDIPDIVRWVAAVMTLIPGDIIYSGTPGSPAALKSGDVMEIEVSGVGILTNRVA
jgi:2-keto-4-pentenoate hydratase/2-oxohepta-3-ene-1,7-dioic acid hydratase in catechol pathway